jgi:hypothetical protein
MTDQSTTRSGISDPTADELIYDAAVAIAALDTLTAEHVTQLPIEQAANHLVELRAVLITLRQIEALYERWIYAIFVDQGWRTGHDHPRQVDGVGDVEVGKSKTEKWDSEGVLKAWLAAFMEEHEGNADPYVLIPALMQVLGVVKQDGTYSTSTSWRKTPLKALGLEPDDHIIDVVYGAPKVKITESNDSDA